MDNKDANNTVVNKVVTINTNGLNKKIINKIKSMKKLYNFLFILLMLVSTAGIIYHFILPQFISNDKMICTSNSGSIVLEYNKKDGLVSYSTNDLLFDFDNQKEIADQIGIDEYLSEFKTWFETNTTGKCK